MRRVLAQPGSGADEPTAVRRPRGPGHPEAWVLKRAQTLARTLLVATLAATLAGWGTLTVFAQFSGRASPQVQVTFGTRVNEEGGRVGLASDGAGRFVVVWAYRPDGRTFDIFLRRYGTDSSPLSAREIQVNTGAAGDQVQPSVAMAPDGRFVVAWSGPGGVGDGTDVFAQRFDAQGAPDGGEFRVNAAPAGAQAAPAASMNEDGSFVVAWTSVATDGSGRVTARRFDAGGVAAPGGAFDVASVGADTLTGVDAATASAGGFVVVWARRGAGEAIQGRRYAPNGAARSEEPFTIDGLATGEVRAPRVAMGTDGGFVAAWQRRAQGGSSDVLAQRYAATGAAVGGPMTVNTTPSGDQVMPDVTVEADGDFIVAWSGNGTDDDAGVFVQRFTAGGARVDGEFRANESTVSDQLAPAVAINGTGNFVVAWTSDLELGELHAMARRFAVNNPPVVTLTGGALSYRENAGPVLVDPGATVVDVDSATFAGGSLSVTLTPNLAGDGLSIRNQGTADGQIGTDGATVTYAGRVIGSLNRPPGPLRLVVTFNEHATPEAVQALLRNVTFENGRDDFAAASRTLAAVAHDDWGEQGVTASKTITLVPVNDAPVAVNDAYRVGAGAALDVAARGVLANDTDLDSPSLQAMLVAGPIGGSFALAPSGGFTYTPAVGFAGSDRFTYRAGDGALMSDVATATIVVDPARCAPRPPVRVEARPVGGTLAVTITAQRNELTATNALVKVAIEDAKNATIEVPAQTGTPARNGTADFEIPLTANTTELRFTVRRRAAGAVHVPLVVTDGCPAWRTFVGGGATAF